jgi:hypothetical protein
VREFLTGKLLTTFLGNLSWLDCQLLNSRSAPATKPCAVSQFDAA